MKFVISKVITCEPEEAEKPIDGAVLEEIMQLWNPDKPVLEKHWTIEVRDLEELLSLIDKAEYNFIISERKNEYNGLRCITIYDDYME